MANGAIRVTPVVLVENYEIVNSYLNGKLQAMPVVVVGGGGGTSDVDKAYVDAADLVLQNQIDAIVVHDLTNYYTKTEIDQSESNQNDELNAIKISPKVVAVVSYEIDLQVIPTADLEIGNQALVFSYAANEHAAIFKWNGSSWDVFNTMPIYYTRTTIDRKMDLKTDLTEFEEYKAFNAPIIYSYLVTPTTAITVGNGTSYNLITTLLNSNITVNSGQIGIDGLVDETNDLLKFLAREGKTNYTIRININGTFTGSAGTPREALVQLQRNDNSIISGGNIIKVNGSDLSNRGVNFPTFTDGVTDNFTTDGVKIVVNNISTTNLTITSFTILVQAN